MSAPRIPFASSLADCVNRLARLQLTREMRPRPRAAGVRPVEKAIDRLIVAARRVARLSVVILALTVALSGCGRAIPGKTFLLPTWATQLAPEERAEADRVEEAIDRLCVEILKQNPPKTSDNPCNKPTIFVWDRDVLAQFNPEQNQLRLPRKLLTRTEVGDAVIAHELAHWSFIDARIHSSARGGTYFDDQVVAEQNANFHAVWILRTAFDYTDQAALQAVWRLLVGGVRSRSKPTVGHPDACAELHAFERRVGATRAYDCQENGGRP